MVHIKITCADCGEEHETDCKGVLCFVVDPKDKLNTGVYTEIHHIAFPEILPAIMRYVLSEFAEEMGKMEDAATTEKLLSQIKDIEDKLRGL